MREKKGFKERGLRKQNERKKNEFENVLRGTFWLAWMCCVDWWKFFYFWY